MSEQSSPSSVSVPPQGTRTPLSASRLLSPLAGRTTSRQARGRSPPFRSARQSMHMLAILFSNFHLFV
jgi:hypothetical protein